MKLKKLLKDFAASRFETKKVPLVFNFFLLFLVGILLALSLYSHLDKVAFRIENKIDLIAENQNQSTVAGDVTNLIFSYENKSGKQLNQATLTFNLPNSFELIGGSPSQKFDQKTITFNLGDLDINAKGAINLSGKFWAMPKTEQQIYSILTFIPEGNTAKRTKKINQLINISDSPLSLTIKATDWAFAGQPVTFYVTLENKSDNTINNLSLSHNLLSNNLIITSSTLPIKNITLNPKQSLTGTIVAKTVKNNINKTLNSFKIQITTDNSSNQLAENNITINFKKSKIDLVIKANSTNANFGVNSYLATIINHENFTVKNITLNITEDNLLGDTNIKFDRTNTLALASLNPEASIVIPFSINLKDGEQKNNFLNIATQLNYTMPDGNIGFQSADVINQKINTLMTLPVTLKYFTAEGDQIGFGPLPPKIGEATRYWVAMQVTSNINDLRDLQVKTSLGQNVRWTGQYTTTANGGVHYDTKNNLITWNVDTVNAPSANYPSIACAFEVEFTPTADQGGMVGKIINTTTASAQDTLTGETLTYSTKPINTDAALDKNGLINGKIR